MKKFKTINLNDAVMLTNDEQKLVFGGSGNGSGSGLSEELRKACVSTECRYDTFDQSGNAIVAVTKCTFDSRTSDDGSGSGSFYRCVCVKAGHSGVIPTGTESC